MQPQLKAEWVDLPTLAAWFGVPYMRVWRWCEAGLLKATPGCPSLHYTDERVRKTTRTRRLVYREDLADFLERMRGSRRIPPGLLRDK